MGRRGRSTRSTSAGARIPTSCSVSCARPACPRAETLTGRSFPYDRVTIIGDTPLDVDCARACGARAVAVATGFHSGDELAACEPDLLFGDFADVGRVLEALGPHP